MMMKELKKIGLIGAAGFFASLSLFGGVGASADWTTEPDDGTAETSSEVPTNLWCAWYVNGMSADVILYPITDLPKSEIEELAADPAYELAALEEYDGSELVLTGYSLGTEALVAGWQEGASPQVSDRKLDGVLITDEIYDCSWYNSQLGFTSTVSVEATGNQNFVATYVDGDGLDAPDTKMDFGLDAGVSGDGIAISFVENPSTNCDADFALATSAIIEDATETSEVASVPYTDTLSTTLTCMWDTKFVVTMPSQLQPTAPGEQYSFTGPTLKTTVTLDPAANP
jgi:hypothetical protein